MYTYIEMILVKDYKGRAWMEVTVNIVRLEVIGSRVVDITKYGYEKIMKALVSSSLDL